MARYLVSVAIDAYCRVLVDAGSPKEACAAANEIVADKDFGDLEDIEWAIDTVEDEAGGFVDMEDGGDGGQ